MHRIAPADKINTNACSSPGSIGLLITPIASAPSALDNFERHLTITVNAWEAKTELTLLRDLVNPKMPSIGSWLRPVVHQRLERNVKVNLVD